jgi:hypothetical protein
MNTVDILFYIADHKGEFPNLQGMSPAQVLARLPTEDARYRLGEAGLRAVLREVR